MSSLILDKDKFISTASDFFNEIFEPAFNNGCGNIEIRTFSKGHVPQQYFFESESEAAEKAYQLCQQGIDVYFGVNPRIGNGGRKENVQYLSAFHAEIDYGTIGHVKESSHGSYEETLKTIQSFSPEPTIIIHSGRGFHCYWVLSNPIKVSDIGISVIESINKTLLSKLSGDPGTQNIDRVLRIPGTFNFKKPDNPRPVTMISNTHRKYAYEDFLRFIPSEASAIKPLINSSNVKQQAQAGDQSSCPVDIDNLPISEKMKNLINHGNDGSYVSRSEADMAVITILVNKGLNETQIKQIFSLYPIGEKYRSHPNPDKYLAHSIESAKGKSNLTEEEMQDPLFICGAIIKNEKRYTLDIVKFEEYMTRKYWIKILDQGKAIFMYNGKCYEQCTDKNINRLCQDELKGHRHLFTRSTLNEFIHYAIGEALINSEKARKDQLNYLTLQNGLYKLDEGILINHMPEIFTTNLLPYDYDPSAKCPRFIKFLDEVLNGDQDTINFIQEAVGYSFHQALPTPGLFLLTGDGNNGKSVFINTITNLVGKENTGNVSFNRLSDEYYVLELFQKMINVSGETPHLKRIETDVIKAVTAGDWITGRELYKQPMKFRSFAKHFLAMNKLPNISDPSYGMWRRVSVINFDRIFTENEVDRELEEKLSMELSGIFNWALEGFRRLRKNKFALTESPSMKESKQEYRNDMDSVRAFARDHLLKTSNPDNKLKLSDLYNQYLAYCRSEGKKDVEKKKTFRKILQDVGFKAENSTKDGNQICIFGVIPLYEN